MRDADLRLQLGRSEYNPCIVDTAVEPHVVDGDAPIRCASDPDDLSRFPCVTNGSGRGSDAHPIANFELDHRRIPRQSPPDRAAFVIPAESTGFLLFFSKKRRRFFHLFAARASDHDEKMCFRRNAA